MCLGCKVRTWWPLGPDSPTAHILSPWILLPQSELFPHNSFDVPTVNRGNVSLVCSPEDMSRLPSSTTRRHVHANSQVVGGIGLWDKTQHCS